MLTSIWISSISVALVGKVWIDMVWGSTVSAVHGLVNERVLVVADTIGAVVEAEVAVVWVDEASSVQGCNSRLRVFVGLEMCKSNVSLYTLNLSIKYLVKLDKSVSNTLPVKFTILYQVGREPWSSGYGSRLTFQRSWVRIPAPDTGWT